MGGADPPRDPGPVLRQEPGGGAVTHQQAHLHLSLLQHNRSRIILVTEPSFALSFNMLTPTQHTDTFEHGKRND